MAGEGSAPETSRDGSGNVRAYRVEGRVQGVGFRWWTRKTADDLGLRGSVRNCPDGSVEVHAAGDQEALDALEEALARGPSSARVVSVRSTEPASGAADWSGFTIDRS